MDKIFLLKYLREELTPSQEKEVLEWVSLSEENEKEFIELTNIEAFTSSSDEKATEEEYLGMMKHIESREKLARRGRGRSRVIAWITSAAAVVLLIANVTLMIRNSSPADQTNQTALLPAKNYEGYKELYTNKGVKAMVVLPDSSKVWLNSDTKLIYPDRFDSISRNVRIEGEGYFKVKSDPSRPMFVTTGKEFTIKVTGTEFNVKANKNDDKAHTTLYQGKIDILRERNGKWSTTPVLPNQTFTIDTKNKTTSIVAPKEPAKLSQWREGKLVFDKTPMSEVAKMLERWHGVHIVLDKKIENLIITATFEEESVVQIMELFEIIAPIKYSIKNNKEVIITKR